MSDNKEEKINLTHASRLANQPRILYANHADLRHTTTPYKEACALFYFSCLRDDPVMELEALQEIRKAHDLAPPSKKAL